MDGHQRLLACAVDLERGEVNAADGCPSLPAQLYWAPDAYGGQPGALVPAEAELGLAYGDALRVPAPLVGDRLTRVVERALEA